MNISYEQWVDAYKLWVMGDPITGKKYSLMEIGHKLGLKTSAAYYFPKVFGKGCTAPKKVSFIRSLLEDYPDSDWVKALDPLIHKHDMLYMSRASERAKSKQKGASVEAPCYSVEMGYKLAYQRQIENPHDPWEQFEQELTLNNVIYVIEVTLSVLENLLRCSVPSQDLIDYYDDKLQTATDQASRVQSRPRKHPNRR